MFRQWIPVAGAALIVAVSTPANTGEVELKDGLLLEGDVFPVAGLTEQLAGAAKSKWQTRPFLVVDSGVARYFVHRRSRVRKLNPAVQLGGKEEFKIRQIRLGGAKTPSTLGSVIPLGPFDEFGRRRVKIAMAGGKKMEVVQAITRVRSDYITVEAIGLKWRFGIKTTSIPTGVLDPILRKVTDQTNPEDRLAITRFYLEAGRLKEAANELAAMDKAFPDLKERIKDLNLKLRQNIATQVLNELRLRKAAGQHKLAAGFAKTFPRKDVDASILREVDDLVRADKKIREDIKVVNLELGELQAVIKDKDQLSKLTALRSEVLKQLDAYSIARLNSFLKFKDDTLTSAQEKLALAYSGWIVGANNAVTDIRKMFELEKGRRLILEYLRTTDGGRQDDILKQVNGLEGISKDLIAQIVANLPPVIETPGIAAGKIHRVEFTVPETKTTVAYQVLLPAEYSPFRNYPTILAMHAGGGSPAEEIKWWAQQASRRGYIVVAPEYLPTGTRTYDHSAAKHQVVLESLRNARRRFSVNSDKVFLSGHAAGGDAAFDIGIAHPDLFAGVIPIAGLADRFVRYYAANGKHLPWFIVGGQLDRYQMHKNANPFNGMMLNGHDILVAEYGGRGFENFYEEIHVIFDWMKTRSRTKHLKKFTAKTLRLTDNRFYWLEMQGLPRAILRPNRVVPRIIDVQVLDGAQKYTLFNLKNTANASTVRLWLSRDMVDFSKRVKVTGSGRKFYDYVKQDVRVLLEDFKRRGDREKLYWAKLEI